MSILFAGTTIAMPLGQVMYGKLFDLLSDRVYIIILGVGFITLIIAFISKITLRNENFRYKEFRPKDLIFTNF